MAASQEHITAATPRGATVVDGGVALRFWAPAAERVFVSFHGAFTFEPVPEEELVRDPATGDWTGFFPGVAAGTKYRFYVFGAGGEGFKRDPRAREPELHGYPECDALSESTLYGYRLGLPRPSGRREVFDSDVCDHFPNPPAAGNAGWVSADGPAAHGFGQSAVLTVPANGLLVFTGEPGQS
jgi:hypothetical protein